MPVNKKSTEKSVFFYVFTYCPRLSKITQEKEDKLLDRHSDSISLVAPITGSIFLYSAIARDYGDSILTPIFAITLVLWHAVRIYAFFAVGRWWELVADYTRK